MAPGAPFLPRKKTGKLPAWLLILYGLFVLSFAFVGVVAGLLVGYNYSLPRIQSLEDYRPDVITDIYSDDNKVIGEFAVERRIIISWEDIPPYYLNALLAAEDNQFFHHSGINYYAMVRAACKDLVAMRKAEGASTITQQLARLLLLSPEKAFDRKIKEILLAWKIERRYSKRQILTLYCNQHYLGLGIYGAAAAADFYFGKQLKDLTLEECALLASLPRNHRMYSPIFHPDAALARRNYILERMVAEGMISAKLAADAKAKPITLKPRRREDLAPYFVEWVRQSLADKYSTDVIWRKGLRVYTTLNIGMQEAANKALRDGLREYDKRHGWRGPIDNILRQPPASLETYTHPDWRNMLRSGDIVTGLVLNAGKSEATVRVGKYTAALGPKEIFWTKAKSPADILKVGDLVKLQIGSLDANKNTASALLDQTPQIQGALITIQNSSGEIKAMVGGYDFEASEFNRATQALRQAGSTFKPFVYSAALESGMMGPDSPVDDAPISFTDALGRVWSPANYDGKFKGPITIRQALAESRNVPTVKIASQIGIKTVLIMARRFGLTGPMEAYLPLSIGACEATPLEMTSAFTVFPMLGQQAKPYFIRRVEDYDHVKQEETLPKIRKVLEPEIAEQMLEMLQNVVQSGTATAAKSLGRPIGGKTGTTNDFTDAWFVGFTPSLTTAVWVGFDAKKSLGDKEAGARVALPIWIQYMREVLKDRPVEHFATGEPGEQLTLGDGPEANPAPRRKLFVEDIPTATPAKRP